MWARRMLGLVVLLPCSCRTEPATQIVVVIDTDIPRDVMDGFATRVLDDERDIVLDRALRLGETAPEVALPADFAIGPRGGDATRQVTVAVDALSGDEVLFTTQAVTTFRESRSLRLDMFLARRCLEEAQRCGEDERCTELGCVPAEIDPRELPPFAPDEGIDASAVDAGAVDAGTVDAGGAVDAVEFLRLVTPSAGGWANLADVAFDAGGALYVLGSYGSGSLVLEQRIQRLPPVTGSAFFLARWEPDGTGPSWAVMYEADSGMSVLDLAIGDDLQIVGNFVGTVDFGLQGSRTVENTAAFHARFSPENGDCLGVRTFEGSGSVARALAVDDDRRTGIVGTFSGDIDLDGVPGPDELGVAQQFMVLLDERGTTICHHSPPSIGDGSLSQGQGITFQGSSPHVMSTFSGSIQAAETESAPGGDTLVIRYTDCAPQEDFLVTGASAQYGRDIAASGDGVSIVGASLGDFSVEGTPYVTQGGYEAFSVHFGAEAPLVSVLGGTGDDSAEAVTAMGGDHVLFTGLLDTRGARFGDVPLELLWGFEAYVARLDEAGVPYGLLEMGSNLPLSAQGLAFSPASGMAAVVGAASGTAQLGPFEQQFSDPADYLLVFRP